MRAPSGTGIKRIDRYREDHQKHASCLEIYGIQQQIKSVKSMMVPVNPRDRLPGKQVAEGS